MEGSYVNLRDAFIVAGDWWEVVDSQNTSYTYYIEIISIDRDKPYTGDKTLYVKVLKDVNKVTKTNEAKEMKLILASAGNAIYARRAKAFDENVTLKYKDLDKTAWAKAVYAETLMLLQSVPEDKFRIKFVDVFEYLKRNDYFAPDDVFIEHKRSLMNAYDLLSNGAIRAYGIHLKLTKMPSKELTKVVVGDTGNRRKKVNLDKFVAGLKLVLASGIFGEYDFE